MNKLIGKLKCKFAKRHERNKAPIIERWKVGEGKIVVYKCTRCDAELWRTIYER